MLRPVRARPRCHKAAIHITSVGPVAQPTTDSTESRPSVTAFKEKSVPSSTFPNVGPTPTGVTLREGVVVIGAGGHGKVVLSALQAAGIIVEAVYDDDSSKWGQHVLGVPILGPVLSLKNAAQKRGVIGIGDNRIRLKLVDALSLDWITVVHPFTCVHPTATIGPGSVIMAGAIIQPGAKIGRHCIVNTSASIDHDCVVGDFSAIGPGTNLSGAVDIGERCLLGTGCAVIPGIHIENDVIVGAGTTVIRNLVSGCTVVGAAPRIIRSRNTGIKN